MKTILVVDDEREIRLALEGVFRDEGFAVISAASSEEALKRLDGGAPLPELVLLDIWLPGMDGMEALKEIKKSRPDMPVIMISGHANIETAVRTTKLGAYDFIEKPLSLDKVLLTAEHAFENKNSAQRQSGIEASLQRVFQLVITDKISLDQQLTERFL